MRVKELVQIEEIEEVVQINQHNPERIVETFVADERLEQHISFLLERFLNRREKNSFFIIGGYGSGKSHLLSFLGDLFSHPELWQKVKNERIRSFAPQFKEKRFIPIWIRLPSIKADLRDYVWLELEEQLGEIFGELVALAPQQYIRTAEEDPRFENFLREKLDREAPKDAWEHLKSSHPEEAIELARQFFAEIGTRPQIKEDVEEVMERALSLLSTKFGEDTSLVLIIDELYDFLRGKQTPEFARDIAFLRDLGEASRNYKFFVLASLQEDILDPEKVGAERDNLNRIRQRYENLPIPYLNLQKVARERVLKKNEEQEEELRKLYSSLRQRYFPSLGFDERSFVDLYPVHPAMLTFYERVVQEVGQRSILSFLSQSALEIQDQPQDTLVTIAELYDHLQDELAAHTSFGKLVRDIFPYFEENIPYWLEGEEREWALKAIKGLIILHIVGDRRRCQELAELILYRGIEGEVNYQFFAKLMSDLNKKAGTYLYLAKGSGINAVYTIQIGGPPVEVIVNNEMAKIEDDDPGLLRELLGGLQEIGAPREMEAGRWCELKVDWRNTERKGGARFLGEADQNVLQEAEDKLREEDVDFVLLLLRPNLASDYLSQKELRDERILVWRPAELGKEELDTLKRSLAINRLLEEGLEEEVRKRLQFQAQEASREVEQLVRRIYCEKGSLSFLSPPLPYAFQKAVEESVNRLLDCIYPKHPSFLRKINRRMLRDTIRYLAGLAPSSPTSLDYAESLSEAGLLVKEGEGRYRVSEEREPYNLIMDVLKSKSRELVQIKDIYRQLREKPYGFKEEVVEFLILALVSKGVVSIKGIEGEFFRSDLAELVGIDFLEERYYLRKLEIVIPSEVWELLRAILGEVKAETPEDKSALWEKLRELPRQHELGKLEGELGAFHSPFNKDVLIGKWMRTRKRLEELFRIINANPSPEEGFSQLEELLGENYQEFIEAWWDLQSLNEIAGLQEELNREINYLGQISLPPGDRFLAKGKELLAELERDDVANKGFLENWLKEVELFKNGYIERYTALHEEAVGSIAPCWEELRELEESLSTLRALWEIMSDENIANPAEQIRREIEGLKGKRCCKLYKDSLRYSPFCPHCRFNPASPPDIRGQIERLEERLKEEWEGIIGQLRNEEGRIREELGKATSKAREEIEKLLEGNPVPLSEETKEVLRRALKKLKIVDVDLSPSLRDGGIYKVEDFLERIRKALSGIERGENVRIRIKLS